MTTFNSYKDISFSTNLIEQAAKQVDFLREIDKSATLYSPPVLSQALYRYEMFWLPLASDHKNECLSAPIDVEWVWHCHMLRPRKYISDCKAVVGCVINHRLKTLIEYESDKRKSKILWENKYPDVPFDVDIDRNIHENEVAGFQSKITYDIIAAAGRQKEFFYNVSLPHYKDPMFLTLGQDRYQKMLYLKQEAPEQYLVPCYDNDVMWHTHQLNPWDYEKDMMKYFGEVFDHDDSTNDRSEGSKLTDSFVETKALWTETFNENLAQPGAMYRGKPPSGILYKISKAEIHCLATKKTSVSLDLVLKLDEKNEGKFFIISNGYGGSKKMVKLYKSELVSYCSEMKFKTQQFDFDTRYTNCVTFEVMSKNGSVLENGKASLNLLQSIEVVNSQNEDSFEKVEQIGLEGKLDIKWNISAPEQGNVLLFIEKGEYQPETIPENIREEWGPVGVDKVMPDVDNKCIIATHKLKNHISKSDLSARVIHCPSICQSFVQVFYQDKMAAVSNVIGPDQLPTRKMVSKAGVVTLDPQEGERAMLIKNHAGDWAIVTAKWIKSKTNIFGKGPRGSNGTLHAKVSSLSRGNIHVHTCKVGYTKQTFNFTVKSVKADLSKGTIEIDKGTTEVAENIALVLSIAILHERCVPKQQKPSNSPN